VRRGSLFQLIVIGVLIGGAVSAVALLIPWLPPSASVERGRIDLVFWIVTAICIAIFAIVFAVSIFSYMRFRARPDDDSDGPPIHGHTGLEIAWTAVPTVLVVVIAVVSAVALAKNDSIPADHMTVEVTAQQFAWSFTYPGGGDVTTTELRLPLNRSTELELRALDVIHSFWVPEFGQKQDAVPGITTHLKITPDRLGTFPVICTELCGLGHALMRSRAIVMEPTAFQKWLAEAKKGISGPGAGLAVFNNNGCGGCHAFEPANSTGTVGPDLDDLAASAKKAGQPLEPFVRESIVNPDGYVTPGYSPNVMPKTFGSLPESQLDALVEYLVSGGKSS
jgi:cytochrome c oxidase subunit 2